MELEISKGYFPKVGQTKKFFVEGLGYLELTGEEYEVSQGGGEGERKWAVKGRFNDFISFDENDFDYPRVNIEIVGNIWFKFIRKGKGWERKYISEMNDVFVNGERVMVETGRNEFVHGRKKPIMESLEILNWGGEYTQKRCLEEIINKTWKEIYVRFHGHRLPFQEKRKRDENKEFEPHPKTVEKPVVETKRSRIPFIGGIAAIIGSAIFLKSRFK